MVGGFHGMLLLSSNCSRPLGRRENFLWMAIRRTISRPGYSFWSDGRISLYSASDLSRLHQFGPKVLPVIFLGYVLHAEGIWKGDILVADNEELEKMVASESRAERPNAKEVLTPKNGDKFISPVDGTVKLWERSGSENTLIRDSPERGEEPENLLTPFQVSSMVKQETISAPFQGLFIVITLNPESNCTCREPMKYIDVTRTTHTSLDVLVEKTSWRLLERGHVLQGSRYWVRQKRRGTWSRRRLTRKQTTSRPDPLWPEIWKDLSEASKRKEKQKWAIERPKLDNARRLIGIHFIDPTDEEFKEIMKNARGKLEVPMPAMPCRTGREESRKPVSFWKIVRQNTHASLKPGNLRESVWQELFMKFIKTTLQAKGFTSMTHYNLVHKVYSYAPSNENSGSKSSGR